MFTTQQLHDIQIIQEFVKQHDRVPLYHENRTTPTFPNGAYFRRSFGTLNKAIQAAGLDPTVVTNPDTGKAVGEVKTLLCANCQCDIILTGKSLHIKQADIKRQRAKGKRGNVFCSRSCAATFNNRHKSYGYRRSKLEIYIEEQLAIDFPNLPIMFNSKTAIESELDIYVPSLSLAIELSGIVHYKPIYGIDKFMQIQNNDNHKIICCHERSIKLITIDVSTCSYYKQHPQYYNQVQNILLHELRTIQPTLD